MLGFLKPLFIYAGGRYCVFAPSLTGWFWRPDDEAPNLAPTEEALSPSLLEQAGSAISAPELSFKIFRLFMLNPFELLLRIYQMSRIS